MLASYLFCSQEDIYYPYIYAVSFCILNLAYILR